ncbi:helix-turn-helix domain-containing protein [Candidatus Soleaferrea massiliensis]|uniref:helix-turn-helix domain-containing protein n=1 Tax=Candidatus Soleaferrea massiliensis TaxID=1470354 RepID=UPI0018CE81FD|nr:helix-turn-helix domain-containing protein [Candidatus Soleaferrea massiliensis]
MIGKRLRQLRREHHLSQKQLADELGTSASSIGMYEQGRREPDHGKLAKLCRYFNVPSDYFIDENYPADQTARLTRRYASSEDVRPQELSELLDQMQETLMRQEGLMFNGLPLDEEDIIKVVEAIRIGTSVAMMDHQRRKDGERNRTD